MATKAATRKAELSDQATYQDVLDAPPNMVAEIIEGVLHMNPRPASMHAWASTGLGESIGPPFNRGRGGPGGWWIVDEPELHLGEDILVPDMAGWRRERMPVYPDVKFFTLVPDWICEILLPSTRALDQGMKRGIYAREGVAHLWFVDPHARTLEAFELHDGKWVLLETVTGNDPVSVAPFEAISFSLGELWPDGGMKTEGDSTEDTA